MQLIGDVLDEVVADLKSVGINATTDIKQLNQFPMAFVALGNVEFNITLQADTHTLNIDIYLLTSNKGAVYSMNDLQDLLNKLLQLNWLIPEAQYNTFNVPSATTPVPGFLISIQATIEKD